MKSIKSYRIEGNDSKGYRIEITRSHVAPYERYPKERREVIETVFGAHVPTLAEACALALEKSK